MRLWAATLALNAVALAVWQFASERRVEAGAVSLSHLPAPTEIVQAARSLSIANSVLVDLANSLGWLCAGFAPGVLLGIYAGFAIGRSPWSGVVLKPVLELLKPVPAVVWIPFLILALPSAESSRIAGAFVGVFFPVLLGTIHGAASIDVRLIAAARSLGAHPRNIFREVLLPGALPGIGAGVCAGFGTAWSCVIVSEAIVGQSGLGCLARESYVERHYQQFVVVLSVIGLVGVSGAALLKWIGARFTPWAHPPEGTCK
jgi:NitT/TauT family transport system permease protein